MDVSKHSEAYPDRDSDFLERSLQSCHAGMTNEETDPPPQKKTPNDFSLCFVGATENTKSDWSVEMAEWAGGEKEKQLTEGHSNYQRSEGVREAGSYIHKPFSLI